MNPRALHKESMDYSFKAKQAYEEGSHDVAFDLYKKAAALESQVAEFYFDKPELEPTRSIVIRSAAFLNLKAGLVESAQKFIFFGLLNTNDELIKEQLNNALELSVSLSKLSSNGVSIEYNYLTLLRQRSVNYVIEPSNLAFGHSVSLEMIKVFSESYLKSLKAFAVSKFKKIQEIQNDIEENVVKEIEKLINPLVTNSGYGSFKFSVANDFLLREGETKELLELKSNVVAKYHHEIFINPLTDSDIIEIKKNYTEEEVNDIFRPLTKIKSNNSPIKIGFYDSENFSKNYVNKIVNKQRRQLLTVKQISNEDIGELESSIIHKRNASDGSIRKKTIFKEQLKSYEVDIKINQIEPNDNAPILLSEDIFLNMNFNSNKGFTFSFDDFRVEYTDIEYEKSLKGFYTVFYDKLVFLANRSERNEEEEKDWIAIVKLIGNPDIFVKK